VDGRPANPNGGQPFTKVSGRELGNMPIGLSDLEKLRLEVFFRLQIGQSLGFLRQFPGIDNDPL